VSSPRSNEAWISALQAGDEGALRELRAHLLAGLRRSLGGKLGDQVDDVAQDAVLRVLDGIGSFRGDSRFTSWAMAIAMRLAFTELRKARWKDRSLDDVLEAEGARGDEADAVRGVARERVLDALAEAVQGALTERQRTAVVAELRGVPQAVLAERLSISRNALYKLTFDARRALARELAASGIDREEVVWAFHAEGEG
jgi:RNA polymerase sigma-70 factor, ECF subfamily